MVNAVIETHNELELCLISQLVSKSKLSHDSAPLVQGGFKGLAHGRAQQGQLVNTPKLLIRK